MLLHGFGTSSFLWRNVGPGLALEQHTAYAIDLFGYGESDRHFDADFGLAAQAEYIERALTALRVARAVIVGVDLGGGVALRLAATRPDRVSGLVLVNSVAFDELPSADIRGLQRNTARFALRISRGLFGAAPLLTPLLEGSVADPDRMPPRLVARYLAPYVGREGVSHLLALARALKDDELEEVDLAQVVAPALVIRGEEDRWLDDAIAVRLAGALPSGRLERIPGVGRLIPEEAPERVTELILQSVQSAEPA